MMLNISQADAVNDACSILADIGTSSPSWVIDRIFGQLIYFIATSQDDVAFFEFFVFHVFCVLKVFAVKVDI